MPEFMQTVEKLCSASRRQYLDPYTYLEWPEALDPDQWQFSPELISIYGTDAYESLTEAERKRLSFYETVNFFSLNIHGERPLVEGLAQRLYRSDTQEITPYLQHFLDEENKHMVYFGGYCTRYAGKVYRDKKMAWPREYATGEEDFLFFAKVMIFEEIVDVYNVTMSKDDRLPPIVRRINLVHHVEESRHLAFGRGLVKELFERHAPSWSPETLQGVRDYLKGYVVATWKEYYNPDAYRDAGLRDPLGVQERAFDDPRCREHRERVTRKCQRYLVENRILEEEATL